MKFLTTTILIVFIATFAFSQQKVKTKAQTTVYPTTIKTPIGFSIDLPFNGDKQFIVVPMPVRVRAFPKNLEILLISKLGLK